LEDEDLIADNVPGTKPAAILISVADNGPGIPEEKVSGLFKKFYQVTPTAPRKHGGTGLGLTICKEIVEMHGGKIWYDSSYKNGACFRFTIPRVAPTNRGKNVVA
jgi:signal transduction histidine kinase